MPSSLHVFRHSSEQQSWVGCQEVDPGYGRTRWRWFRQSSTLLDRSTACGVWEFKDLLASNLISRIVSHNSHSCNLVGHSLPSLGLVMVQVWFLLAMMFLLVFKTWLPRIWHMLMSNGDHFRVPKRKEKKKTNKWRIHKWRIFYSLGIFTRNKVCACKLQHFCLQRNTENIMFTP